MKILLDQGTPAPLRKYLAPHTVDTAHERGWSTLANGELLRAAEMAGYAVFITTDQSLKYQQNLAGRRIAILVLSTTRWRRMELKAVEIADAVGDLEAGSFTVFTVP